MYKHAFIFIFSALLCGCASVYTKTINQYTMASASIKLGDSKAEVLQKLEPTQSELSVLDKKQPETFKKDGKLVEIYFFRSGWQDDGLTTDDEFTPYIFEDGVLKAIGWTVLGGPKTQGQSRPEIDIDPYFYHHRPYPYRY